MFYFLIRDLKFKPTYTKNRLIVWPDDKKKYYETDLFVDKFTSCKKSAVPFLSGHLKPHVSKNWSMYSRGPWYTIWPSDRRMISSNRSNVSGAGWSREINMVASVRCTICCKHFTIWYAVELSRPVDISSMNSVFVGPTIISPVYWPNFCHENNQL